MMQSNNQSPGVRFEDQFTKCGPAERSDSKQNDRQSTPLKTDPESDAELWRRISEARRLSGGSCGSMGSFDETDEVIDLFRDEQTGKFKVSGFFKVLSENGIRLDDPRLKDVQQYLKDLMDPNDSLSGVQLDKKAFKAAIMNCMVLVSKSLNKQFVIPDWSSFTDRIGEIFEKCKEITGGTNAQYIPELARVDPDLFGVSVCTIDGQRHSWGDTRHPFCIQSISKAFTYAINLQDLGADFVHKRIGTEPSGRLFNEICLDRESRPHNPMINAGAIVCSALVRPHLSQADRFSFVAQQYKRLAGGEYIGFSNATFLSERETADRNYCLSYYLREHGNFASTDTDIRLLLEFYFQLCSVEVTAESLAVMAATLANGGVCPITGEHVINNATCRDVLSLMYSCGMYDYSGCFQFNVGLPAKSGVGGGIVVVIPNVCGFCTFSPPLDKIGNSVKGVAFYEELVRIFNFHNFDNVLNLERLCDPRNTRSGTECQQADGSISNVLFAAMKGDIRAVRGLNVFLLQGLDLNNMDYDGRTALHMAACEGHAELVEFLLTRCRVWPSPTDRWGHTPYDDAKQFGHVDCMRLLEQLSDTQLSGDDEVVVGEGVVDNRSANPPPSPATVPAATVPSVSVPPAMVPPTTVPTSTVPSASVPPAMVPPATVPLATVPSASVPPATVPAASVPPAAPPAPMPNSSQS